MLNRYRIIALTVLFIIVFIGYVYPVIIAEDDPEYRTQYDNPSSDTYIMYENKSGVIYNDSFIVDYKLAINNSDSEHYPLYHNISLNSIYKFDRNLNIGYRNFTTNEGLNRRSVDIWPRRINSSTLSYKLTTQAEEHNNCYFGDVKDYYTGKPKYKIKDLRRNSITIKPIRYYMHTSEGFVENINNSKIEISEGYKKYTLPYNKNEISHIENTTGNIKVKKFNGKESFKSSNISVESLQTGIRKFGIVPIWRKGNVNMSLDGELNRNITYNFTTEDKKWIDNAIRCVEEEYDKSLPTSIKHRLENTTN